MANDLVTRLLLNSTQFDNNLSKSARQVQNFQKTSNTISKGVSSAFGSITSAAGKIAPQLGLAIGAFEGFNKVIKSSQTLTDAWGRTTEATTSIIDGLFQSISAGSFMEFISGLDDVIGRARDAYNAIDALSTLYAFSDKKTSEIAKERAKVRADLKRGIIDQAEAQKRLNKLEQEEQQYLQHIAQTNKNAFYAKLSEYTKSDAGKGWISKYFYEGGQDDAKKEADRLQSIFNSMDFRRAKQQGNWDLMTQMLGGLTYDEARRKVASLLNFNELGDEKISELDRLWGNANRAETTYYNNLYKDQRILNSGRKKGGTKTGGTTTKSTGSTEPAAPSFTQDQMDDFSALGFYLDSKLSAWGKQWGEKTAKEFNKSFQETVQNGGLSLSGDSINEAFNTSVQTEGLKIHIQQANALANAWQNIGTVINSAAGAMSNFGNEGVNVAALIAQTIATVALAYAQTLASDQTSKSNIWSFIAAAAGATISMATTIASIHKATGYATGGIVGGNDFVGDKRTVRVNSGEMILNKQQQANLFNMINAGKASGGNGGQVQFKIQGKELVGVLSNYNNKVNRAR